MGKKKAATDIDKTEAWEKEIQKKYGNIMFGADSIKNDIKNIIPVSPALDIALSGGIPEGSWCIFSGPAKCGKSSLCLQIAANAQKLFNKKIFIGDAEGRFEDIHLNSVSSLDISKITVIKSTQEKILSAEDHLEIYKSILKNNPGCILVIDSASALCGETELTSEITAKGRNVGGKLLATFCRQMGQVVSVQKSIVMVVQHLIANTSGYGSPYMEDGGSKIKYQADIKLRCKKVSKWLDENEKQIGQAVEWDTLYSSLGPPVSKTTSFLRYAHGLDSSMEILQLALELGIIVKSGAWFQYRDDKFQGQNKIYNHLINNIEIQKSIVEEIRNILT